MKELNLQPSITVSPPSLQIEVKSGLNWCRLTARQKGISQAQTYSIPTVLAKIYCIKTFLDNFLCIKTTNTIFTKGNFAAFYTDILF